LSRQFSAFLVLDVSAFLVLDAAAQVDQRQRLSRNKLQA
jgi:hypothetical protein